VAKIGPNLSKLLSNIKGYTLLSHNVDVLKSHMCVTDVQRSVQHDDEESDVGADSPDDQSKMLSDTHDVKLRHCGFCGIEVSTVLDSPGGGGWGFNRH